MLLSLRSTLGAGQYRLTAEGPLTTTPVSGIPTGPGYGRIRKLNGRWYALAGSNASANVYSDDGVNWYTFTTPGTISGGRCGMAYGNGTYVIVPGSTNTTQFYVSTDGINFTTVTHGGSGFAFREVVYAEGVFVTVSSGGRILSSPDGTNWTIRYDAVSASAIFFNTVMHDGTKFIAVGGGTSGIILFYSDDGITWTRGYNVVGAADATSLAYNGTTYVLITYSSGGGSLAHTSTDGLNWYTFSSGVTPIAKATSSQVAWTGSEFIAVTEDQPALFWSHDGYTWNKRDTTGEFVPVGIGSDGAGTTFIACSSSTVGTPRIRKLTSPMSGALKLSSATSTSYESYGPRLNRLTAGPEFVWQPTDNYPFGEVRRPAFTTGLGVAGQFSTTSVIRSTDGGLTWTTSTINTLATNAWMRSAAFGAGLFVIVGGTGSGTSSIQTSATGASSSWTNQTVPFTNSLYDVIFADGVFVAVGNGGKIATSTDGIAWTNRTSNVTSNLETISHNGAGMFLATGANGVTTRSTDGGVTWTAGTVSTYTTTTFLTRWLPSKSLWVAVNYGGFWCYSSNGTSWTLGPVTRIGDFSGAVGVEVLDGTTLVICGGDSLIYSDDPVSGEWRYTNSASPGSNSRGFSAVGKSPEGYYVAFDAVQPGLLTYTKPNQQFTITGSDTGLWKSEAPDTLSAAATVESPAAEGTLAVTESGDTLASAGSVLVSGAAAHTDSGDTFTGVAPVLVGGSASNTDSPDTASGAATTTITSSSNTTDGPDTLSSTATAAFAPATATLATTDSPDTATTTVSVVVSTSLDVSEGEDVGLDFASVLVEGSLAVSEAADTLLATAGGDAEGSVNYTEASDTLASAVDVPVSGAVAYADVDDALTSAGEVLVSGSAAHNDSADTFASTGTILVDSSLAGSESADSAVSVSVVDVVGTATPAEAADTLASSVTSEFIPALADLATADSEDTLASTVGVVAAATLAANEGGDTGLDYVSVLVDATLASTDSAESVSAVALVDVVSTGTYTDLEDVGASVGSVLVAGTVAHTDSAETLAAVADPDTAGTLAFSESADGFSSAGAVTVGAATEYTDVDDTASSAATISISTALASTEAGDTLSATGTAQFIVFTTLASTEAADTVSSAVGVAVTSALAVNEGEDTGLDYASVLVDATLAKTEIADSLIADSIVPVTGQGSHTDAADTLVAGVFVETIVFTTLAVTEGADTASGSGSVGVTATEAGVDSPDTGAGSISVVAAGAATSTEIGDTVTAQVQAFVAAQLAAVDSGDSLAARSNNGEFIVNATRAKLLYNLALVHGLVRGTPLVVNPTSSRTAGGLQQTVSGSVVHTTALAEFDADFDQMLDDILAIHGLTTDLAVTNTSRTAGSISQTLALDNGVTTVTRV